MPYAVISAGNRRIVSAAQRGIVAVAHGIVPTATINSIALSNTVGIDNSAAGTIIGTFSANVTGTLVNPVYTLTNSDSNAFEIVNGNQLAFLSPSVPQGSPNITVQLAASNATSASATIALTIQGPSSAALVGTPSNMPTGGTAINPLTQGYLVFSGINIAYVCLYHNGADEGTRVGFGGGQMPPLVPEDVNGGAYTVRVYDAPTGGNCFYESPTFNVASNVYRVGGTLNIVSWPSNYSSAIAVNGSNPTVDDYFNFSGPMSDGGVWIGTSGTIPPDQPGQTPITSHLHILDHINTRLYGRCYYITPAGTYWLWAIVTSAVDGTTSRVCYPTSFTVS